MAKPKLDSAGISLFCESVAMMLAAGIQTDEAVGMLSEDIGDVALQATCESVYGRLCAGDTLAVAMKAVLSANAPVCYFTMNHGESMSDYSLMFAATDAGYMVNYLCLLYTSDAADD